MSTMVSPSLSPFSSSSSPPPSPQQVRISQSQQMSPRSQQSSSSLSRPLQSGHASPAVASMRPPPAPSPGAFTSNPGPAAVPSPRLKRPLSSEHINPNLAASATPPPATSAPDYRSSPRSAKRPGPSTLSSASSPRVRNSPLIRRAAESTVRTPQSQIRNPQPINTNPNETSLDPLTLGSPSKRAKPMQLVRKLVPRDYQLCAMNDLVVLISDMLNQLVSLNDGIPLTQGGLTRFHSRAPPTITITDYLHRIALHTTLEPSTLLSMVYYIDLLSNHYPAFTISSLTVHRFLITAATVSSKGLCDSFCTNTFYARVGGISLRELNVLELEFLNRVGWRIVPQAEVLREYYVSLVRRMGDGWGFEEGPESEYSTDELFDESSSGAGSYVSGSDTKGSPHLQAKASFLSGNAPIAGSQDKDAPSEASSSGAESR
ncbi:Cyclin-U4-1 [Arthrobotrys entomopaga]|nr:Cyclin-U4-1 [Arthrobotrys entomopaga]